MGIFPADAVAYSLDAYSNTMCTSSAYALLSPVAWDRTILYAKTFTRATSTNPDYHITDSSKSYPNNVVLDSENGSLPNSEIWTNWILPAGARLSCTKPLNDHVNFHIVYTNYNMASTSLPAEIINSNNIENITYQATTTQVSPTQQQTVASYYIPNFLFIYVGILVLSIFGVLFYAKKK